VGIRPWAGICSLGLSEHGRSIPKGELTVVPVPTGTIRSQKIHPKDGFISATVDNGKLHQDVLVSDLNIQSH
jgi:hypothetical protein